MGAPSGPQCVMLLPADAAASDKVVGAAAAAAAGAAAAAAAPLADAARGAPATAARAILSLRGVSPGPSGGPSGAATPWGPSEEVRAHLCASASERRGFFMFLRKRHSFLCI